MLNAKMLKRNVLKDPITVLCNLCHELFRFTKVEYFCKTRSTKLENAVSYLPELYLVCVIKVYDDNEVNTWTKATLLNDFHGNIKIFLKI